MQKKWKWCLKKISVEKKSRKILKVKKWLQIHNKNTSHLKRLKKTTTTTATKNKPKILQKSMTNSCLWSHCDCWLEQHWKSAISDWTKTGEGRRSGKSWKTEAKKKTQDLNGVGWSVLEAVTTLRTSGVSIPYNLYMVISYLFQISSQCYKKLSFLQYKGNSYIKETRLVLIFKRHCIE